MAHTDICLLDFVHFKSFGFIYNTLETLVYNAGATGGISQKVPFLDMPLYLYKMYIYITFQL